MICINNKINLKDYSRIYQANYKIYNKTKKLCFWCDYLYTNNYIYNIEINIFYK